MKIHLLLFCGLLLSFSSIQSQNNDTVITKNESGPYELLSGYYNNNFNPFKKRNVYVGVAVSLEDRTQQNDQNLLQTVIDGERTNYDVLIQTGYYINDFSMVGVDFNFYENKFQGDLFRDPDTLQSNTITRGFSFTPNFRTSIPLTKNNRFSFFTSAGLTLGKSNTLKREIKNTDEIEKSYSENYNLRLGLSPGITFFALENFALEVQLDVLGYELNAEEKTINDKVTSEDIRHNIDFKLNLLSMRLGLAYYFGNKK